MQIDNLAELGKEKMPPERIVWDGNSDELEEWIDNVLNRKPRDNVLMVNPSEIED